MRITLLTTVLFLSACATNNATTGPSLDERIAAAEQLIKVVTSKSADWCGPLTSCKYVGDIYCDVDDEEDDLNPEEICAKQIKIQTVQHGGDTIVMQHKGMVKGSEDYYRSFGQVYNCSNTNQELHKEYVATEKLKPLSTLKVVTKTYAEQCKTAAGCKINIRKWSCGSIRSEPFIRCREKFVRDLKAGRSTTNHIVYKDDLVNKAGVYRFYIDSYICK